MYRNVPNGKGCISGATSESFGAWVTGVFLACVCEIRASWAQEL